MIGSFVVTGLLQACAENPPVVRHCVKLMDKMKSDEIFALPSSENDLGVFREWIKTDGIENLTCRPVEKGKRVSPSKDVEIFSFFFEDRAVPAGKFTLFDFNPRNRSAEFGYSIHPQRRNAKIGSEMLIFFVNKIFKERDMNKLFCQTCSTNIASVKLLEKLDFKRDAVLREHHEIGGSLFDDYIFSLLRGEWQQSRVFNKRI